MAGWDRYGEEKKYRKDVDINDNPKHVGEPLRKLTLEDRMELRRQAREQQKKRAVQAQIEEEELSDEDLVQASSPSKRPKTSGFTNLEDGELDIIGVASNGKSKSKEVVDLAEDDSKTRAAAIRRARRRAKAKGQPQKPSEVEVLE